MSKTFQTSAVSAWLLILLGGLFLAIGVGVGWVFWSGEESLLGALLFLLFFGGAGAYMVGRGLLTLYSYALLGKPEINYSTTSLPVGGTFQFSLQHTFPRAMELENVHLQLILREIATYKQGTKTRTVTYDAVVDEQVWPGQAYYEGQMLQIGYGLTIPRDGMHSFKAPRNEIRWVCKLTMGIPRLPDYEHEVVLEVQPHLAPKN